MKNLLVAVLLLLTLNTFAQEPDMVYMPNIKGVKLCLLGNQTGYPIINLGAAGVTELHFDDLDGYIKTYNYTFQLCDADWQPADLSPFDYIQGFSQGRFTQYRASAVAKRAIDGSGLRPMPSLLQAWSARRTTISGTLVVSSVAR